MKWLQKATLTGMNSAVARLINCNSLNVSSEACRVATACALTDNPAQKLQHNYCAVDATRRDVSNRGKGLISLTISSNSFPAVVWHVNEIIRLNDYVLLQTHIIVAIYSSSLLIATYTCNLKKVLYRMSVNWC